MKIVTLRNNERLKDEGGKTVDPVSVTMAAVSIYGALKGLFGGGEGEGGWENGRFIPGDLNNRLTFFSQRMAERGLSINDIDQATVDSFIYQPSGWQGNIDRYVDAVYKDKQANPEKYNAYTPPSGTNTYIPPAGTITPSASGLNLSGFGNLNLTSLLMIGAGVYLFSQLTGSKKRK